MQKITTEESQKAQIRSLLVKGEIASALDYLQDVVPPKSELGDRILSVQGQFNDLYSKEITGSLPKELVDRERSKIIEVILTIISELPSKEVLLSPQNGFWGRLKYLFNF
ncbi:MAG: hypothetical protein AAF655_20170 [Bacteroidota bacterium]